jgi:hypothetical protein
LILHHNGRTTASTIVNSTVTVATGTLTATSIVCDSLVIGGTSESSPVEAETAEIAAVENSSESPAAAEDSSAALEISPAKSSASTEETASGNTDRIAGSLESIATVVLADRVETDSMESVILLQSPIYATFASTEIETKALAENSTDTLARRFSAATQPSPVLSPVVARPLSSADNGRETRIVALQSVVRELQEAADPFAEYGFIHQKQSSRITGNRAKAVDAALALSLNSSETY